MKKNYYIIGLGILILSFFVDKFVALFLVNIKINFLTKIAFIINNFEGYFIFPIALIVILLAKKKENIIPLILSFVAYLGLTSIIKITISRERPFKALDFEGLINNVNENRSFPSGHTTAASAIIPFFNFNKYLNFTWIFITIIVMFSRMYLGVHYLSDVIAGFLLGNLIGDSSIKFYKKYKNFM